MVRFRHLFQKHHFSKKRGSFWDYFVCIQLTIMRFQRKKNTSILETSMVSLPAQSIIVAYRVWSVLIQIECFFRGYFRYC